MKTALVAFCTDDYYPVYESFLKPTLSHWNGPHELVRFRNLGWVGATCLKPGVILAALYNYDAVLYLDVDAQIKSKRINELATMPASVGVAGVMLDHNLWYGNDSARRELLTGTLLVRKSARTLIEKWASSCNGSEPDGDVLARVVAETGTKVEELPIDYAYIANRPDGQPGGIPCLDPVVVHNQASRLYRNK